MCQMLPPVIHCKPLQNYYSTQSLNLLMLGCVHGHLSQWTAGSKTAGIRSSLNSSTTKQEIKMGMLSEPGSNPDSASNTLSDSGQVVEQV